MIDPEEIEAIAQAIEGRLHHADTEKRRRRHWPRRALILAVVLLLGIAIIKVVAFFVTGAA